MKTIKIRMGSVESDRVEVVRVLRAFVLKVGDTYHLMAVHRRSVHDCEEDRKLHPGIYAVTLWESGARVYCGDDLDTIGSMTNMLVAKNISARGVDWVKQMLITSAFDQHCNDLPVGDEWVRIVSGDMGSDEEEDEL